MDDNSDHGLYIYGGGTVTALEQLNQLYGIREKLHPLTTVLIVGFKEQVLDKGFQLKAHDVKYIRDIYPEYFRKDGKLKGSFK